MLFNKKIMLRLLMILLVVGFNSCSNDDDDGNPVDEPTEEPTGSFTLPDQPLLDGIVVVENLVMSDDGWIVVRKDDGTEAPDLSEIISYPEYVEAGTYQEYSIQLKENIDLYQGERLWVNLHNDNGDQEFTYNGTNEVDLPLYYGDLMWGFYLITHSFLVDLPVATGKIVAQDQTLEQNGRLIIQSVSNTHPGWVVIYNGTNEEPLFEERISVPLYLEQGSYSELETKLDEDIEIINSEVLWVVLHGDDGDHIFEFDDDQPFVDANNEMVKDSFSLDFSWPTGSITVLDQVINDRIIDISAVEINEAGWFVLHEDANGSALSTEIISEPKYLEAGSYLNITLALKPDFQVKASQTLWVALYSDDGDKIYENDGTVETDSPFTKINGAPLAESFTGGITTPQQFNFLTYLYPSGIVIGTTSQDWLDWAGWIVIYRDNGSNAPSMSEIVSTPVFLETGEGYTTLIFLNEVEVSDNELLWIVFHNDDGDGVFENSSSNEIDSPLKNAADQIIMYSFRRENLTWM